VIDLDIQKFFDSVDHDLMIKAVEANIAADQRWVLLYVIPEGAGPVNPVTCVADLFRPLSACL
jgi:hypothetical protein